MTLDRPSDHALKIAGIQGVHIRRDCGFCPNSASLAGPWQRGAHGGGAGVRAEGLHKALRVAPQRLPHAHVDQARPAALAVLEVYGDDLGRACAPRTRPRLSAALHRMLDPRVSGCHAVLPAHIECIRTFTLPMLHRPGSLSLHMLHTQRLATA